MSTFRVVFPPGSVACYHPRCAFTISKQMMLPPNTFLEDELGSLLEVLLLFLGAASSSGHHAGSQEKTSHCLMPLHPVLLLGLLPLSPYGEGATHPAGRWTAPSSVGTISSSPQCAAHRAQRWRIQSWTAPPAGAGCQLQS